MDLYRFDFSVRRFNRTGTGAWTLMFESAPTFPDPAVTGMQNSVDLDLALNSVVDVPQGVGPAPQGGSVVNAPTAIRYEINFAQTYPN